MWRALLSLAPLCALATTAAASEVQMAAEGGLSLGMPHRGLGMAPGLRALFEVELIDSIWLGIDTDVRLPGGRKFTLEDPALANDVDMKTGQTALAIGPRAGWIGGDPDGLQYRGALSFGVARLTQRLVSDAGPTRESRSSLWLQPEGGVLFAAGPGSVTASLFWNVAPGRLDTVDAGGSVVGLLVGYRGVF